ncbi:hypothetical protein I3842_08G108200 [Carya illinoinensis]|uniref:Uncharacterized protein n=1 Tax=Carya illinoinensis TaxID=32201 RepID=A0A922EEI0_CARIL|nr:hypothetical protein I3842_08G108200 [Carya illinoinensis]
MTKNSPHNKTHTPAAAPRPSSPPTLTTRVSILYPSWRRYPLPHPHPASPSSPLPIPLVVHLGQMRGMAKYGGLREVRWSWWWLREARGGVWKPWVTAYSGVRGRTRVWVKPILGKRGRGLPCYGSSTVARGEVKGSVVLDRGGWRLTTATIAMTNCVGEPISG